ncbi:hypothetical protein PTKIN_Ptkin14bG0197600 [Pterospermum kingtungense]
MDQDLSAVGMVVEEGRELSSQFVSCGVGHTRREGNGTAQRLAKHGLGLLQEIIWVEEYPPFIHDVVVNDVNPILS